VSDAETHMHFLSEFTRLEQAVGGPDPHMRIVCEGLVRDVADTPEHRAWLIGCYLGPYNVPSGEVVLHYWPDPAMVVANPDEFATWVESAWKQLSLRRERRAIRTPRKFTAHMLGYAEWCLRVAPTIGSARDADEVWDRLMLIAGNGRYATIKLYEALHRVGVIDYPFPDIRPSGGWSPREMLARLHPDTAAHLNAGNTAVLCQIANDKASISRRHLSERLGAQVDWYTMEVVLCEYKQAWDGGQYPGRAHDSELGHVRKVTPLWPDVPFKTLDIRRELFPEIALGEVRGWDGRREGLGGCPSAHGYMWSDTLYDWDATIDLADPVPW